MIPPELHEPINRTFYREARNRSVDCKHGVPRLESVLRYQPERPHRRYPNAVFEVVWCEPCRALKLCYSPTGEPERRIFKNTFPGPIRWDGNPL